MVPLNKQALPRTYSEKHGYQERCQSIFALMPRSCRVTLPISHTKLWELPFNPIRGYSDEHFQSCTSYSLKKLNVSIVVLTSSCWISIIVSKSISSASFLQLVKKKMMQRIFNRSQLPPPGNYVIKNVANTFGKGTSCFLRYPPLTNLSLGSKFGLCSSFQTWDHFCGKG